MTDFILNVKLFAGADYKEAIESAYDLANRLAVNIEFSFNGIDVIVYMNGNVLMINNGKAKSFTIDKLPEHFPY